MLKVISLILLLLFSCLVPLIGEETEQSITTEDIIYLKEALVSILMNTDNSEMDLKKLDNLFLAWELEINQLPKQQEKLWSISQENTKLKIKITLLNISLITVGLISAGELIYIIINS